jgi:hypothetical protein
MQIVEIPLNHYKYRFRKLTFEEEFGLASTAGEDLRRAILTTALTEVSGKVIDSREDAALILGALPKTVVARIWILYRSGLPEERFFSTRGLYRAPDPNEVVLKAVEDQERREEVVDRAFSAMERRFGRKELAEAQAQDALLIADARKRGTLVKATPEEPAE